MANSQRSKIAKRLVQWTIAVVGIIWIVMQLTIRDRVNVVLPNGTVKSCALATAAKEDATSFDVEGFSQPIGRQDVVSQPDRKTVSIHLDPTNVSTPIVDAKLLGLHLVGDLNKQPTVDGLVVANPAGTGGLRITPDEVVGGFRLKTPRPVVERGLISMGRNANPWLLALAIAIFPLTMLVTTLRWDQILRSQDIRLPYTRVFVLNMVGNFYNSFLPGSTGGDFIKAYYAGRQTSHKIRAMLSVFIDRIVGLLALVILGGSMALYGFFANSDAAARHGIVLRDVFLHDNGSLSPTARACLGVAIACSLIVLGSIVGAAVLASSTVRNLLGFEWFISKLPMQHHLDKVRESMRLYKHNAIRFPWWIVITFPIHSTVVLSAMIAGHAFGLNIAWPYYFVCVPVMVLVASLPLSPQGAGVMEYFGFLLLAKQGATVSEVLALTLSIRFVQIFWNLVGGLFTLGGQYGSPHTSYDQIADEDTEEQVPAALPSASI